MTARSSVNSGPHGGAAPTAARVKRCALLVLRDLAAFSRIAIGRPLRAYQMAPAQAILDSVLHSRGRTFAVMMARQAGKNELSAQLEAFLLSLFRRMGGSLVKGSPTYKPQTVNSILRLCDRLGTPWTQPFHRRDGYIVELGAARAFFFSADPTANVVGATASLLLEGDEVQDIAQEKWDKDFTPMGASTNVTTVLYGTAWTSTTFLARTVAALREQEAADGVRRVFCADAEVVASEVPAYGAYVAAQVARLGRQHPLIKTQYYLEPIDGTGGLFPPQRRALMHGSHPRCHAPEPGLPAGHRVALLVDVGGEDEEEGTAGDRLLLQNPRRDATAITVVDVGPATGPRGDPSGSCGASEILPATRQNSYRVVDRALFLGTPHAALYGRILALARHWHAAWIVVDATGVGAGLASFLAKALGEHVIPVAFSASVKSDLGWDFLGIVETGRFQDYADDGAPDTRQFWYEVEACTYEIAPGPGKRMGWGVFEPPAYDGLVARGHDDLLISAALCALLERRVVPGDAIGQVVATGDPLAEVDRASWD